MDKQQHDPIRELALAGMLREVAAKGGEVTREELEAAIAQDPHGEAARRFDEYQQIAIATGLTLRALADAGIDRNTVAPEALMHAVEATRTLLEQQADVHAVLGDAPDLDRDDGPSMG